MTIEGRRVKDQIQSRGEKYQVENTISEIVRWFIEKR